jgi:hypothetical protein
MPSENPARKYETDRPPVLVARNLPPGLPVPLDRTAGKWSHAADNQAGWHFFPPARVLPRSRRRVRVKWDRFPPLPVSKCRSRQRAGWLAPSWPRARFGWPDRIGAVTQVHRQKTPTAPAMDSSAEKDPQCRRAMPFPLFAKPALPVRSPGTPKTRSNPTAPAHRLVSNSAYGFSSPPGHRFFATARRRR